MCMCTCMMYVYTTYMLHIHKGTCTCTGTHKYIMTKTSQCQLECFAIFSFCKCVQFLHFGNVCGNFFRCGRKQDKKPPLALFPLFLLVAAVVVRDLSSLAAAVIDLVAEGVGVAGLVDVVLTYLLLASFLSALASFSVVTWPCFCFLYKPLKYSSSDVKDRSDKREASSTKVALWTFKNPTSIKRKLSRPMIFTPECFNLPQ